MNEFSQLTKESIAYYVYALIDPRDNKIFYIGKGHDDRVFCHINDALNPQNIAVNNDKYEIIRDITRNNNNVKHYILRHNMNETEAFIVESVLINLLTFKDFKHIANISNIICGYRQEEHGIKTAEEVELYYNCQDLVDIQHNILSININEKYNSENVTVYEATRKSWVLDQKRANNVEYVVGEYRGIIRGIFKPNNNGWQLVDEFVNAKKQRYGFEGKEVTDPNILALYLNKRIIKKHGQANPVFYIKKTVCK